MSRRRGILAGLGQRQESPLPGEAALRHRLTRRGLAPSVGVMQRPAGRHGRSAPERSRLLLHPRGHALRGVRAILGGSPPALRKSLSAMSMTRWWKVASLLLVAGATVSGSGNGRKGRCRRGPLQAGQGQWRRALASIRSPRVKSGKFGVSIARTGLPVGRPRVSRAQSCRGLDDASSRSCPEGTRVKKGDLVCELDYPRFETS